MDNPRRKTTLALCGFMACGKTTLGKRLAAALHYDFADTDEMLFAQTQMTLKQMFDAGGEAYFRDLEHETVCRAALLPKTVISTGGGVVTFERNVRALAPHAEIIHIRRSFDACYESITRRKDRPIAGQKSKEELRRMYDARLDAYSRCASFCVDNDGAPEEALRALLDWLGA